MKPFKFLLLSLALSVSSMMYSNTSERIDPNELSAEIEQLLRNANQFIPEGESIILFFSISEDKSIQYITVASTDFKTSAILEKKLQHQKLDGEKWREGMIYELTIKGRKSSKGCVAAY